MPPINLSVNIKKLNLNLIKPLVTTTNFQELQKTKEHVKLYHRGTISKTQNGKHYREKNLVVVFFPTNKLQKEENKMGKKHIH